MRFIDMRALDELRKLKLFFKDESSHGLSVSDLYELIQHADNVLPRLLTEHFGDDDATQIDLDLDEMYFHLSILFHDYFSIHPVFVLLDLPPLPSKKTFTGNDGMS